MAKHHWQRINEVKDVINREPIDLWNGAIGYFEWSDANPLETYKTVLVGKEAGKHVDIKSVRPYSVKAFCLHCNLTEDYIRDVRNSKEDGNDWYVVISKVLLIIYLQNVEMAQTDNFNPNFTAKLLGLGNIEDEIKKPIEIKVITDRIPSLSNSENEILEKLELEKRDL